MGKTKVIVGGFMSMDGKTAPANRVGRIFTEFMHPRHQKMLHRIRSQVDAVIVGVDTVIADNPSLTVREIEGRNPIRVVLDSNARIPLDSKILNTDEAPTIIAITKNAPEDRVESLKSKNVEVYVSTGTESIDVKELLHELESRGLDRILVEGGGEVRWSFFKEKLVDEIFLWIMPYVWGGRNAPTMVDGEGFIKKENAVPLKLKSMKTVDKILMLSYSVKR